MHKNPEEITKRVISLIFLTKKIVGENCSLEKNKDFSKIKLITLRYIKEKKPLMKDVADYLCITPPSATSFVDDLVEGGYVRRILDEQDRRIVRLEITDSGKNTLEEGMKIFFNQISLFLNKLTEEEKKSLIKILEKLTN